MKDLTAREAEREAREKEIMKELELASKNAFAIVESHTRKMVKKILALCFQESKQLLVQAPSYLHLACIMGERTADERSSFGKIKTEGVMLAEDQIDWLLNQYGPDSYELLKDTVERSKDRFHREFCKLEATCVN
jgi:hypothetical protein